MEQVKDNIRVKRKLTIGEEIANAITHGVSALVVLILIPIVYVLMYKNYVNLNANLRDIVGVTIFLFSIFMMFLMSTIYHSINPDSKAKIVTRRLDHIFIFVAIAGTYTPMAISVMGSIPRYGTALAIVIIAVQWTLVLAGIFYKSLLKSKKMTTTLPIYLIMGWTIIILMPLFIKYARPELFWLIFAGGVFYSAGVAFFKFENIKYMHMVWHLFVMLGAFCHIIGICFFI